jgi:hypothetical protein
VFVGLTTHGKGESGRIAANFTRHGFEALDLTHDELAKEHVRHMVGGHSALARDERLLRFVFPERPGALMKFLSHMRPNWNISLFHYRNQGADYGRILVGLQVPASDGGRSRPSSTRWAIRTSRKPPTRSTACSCAADGPGRTGDRLPAALPARGAVLHPAAGHRWLARWVGFSPDMLRASAAHFPGVGWLVGLAGLGAFHEDGLADLVDGLGGSADRDRALEIMKDSRIGAFGAIALVLALLLKVALLATLASVSPIAVLAALLAAHVVSRFWPLVLIRTLAYVGDAAGSKSKPLAERITPAALWLGAAWCAVPVALAVARARTRRRAGRHRRQRLSRVVDAAPARAPAGRLHRRRAGRDAATGRAGVLPGHRDRAGLGVTLWLVRHAATLAPPGLCYGRLDVEADAGDTLRPRRNSPGCCPWASCCAVHRHGAAGNWPTRSRPAGPSWAHPRSMPDCRRWISAAGRDARGTPSASRHDRLDVGFRPPCTGRR